MEAQEALLSDLDAEELNQLGALLRKVEKSISAHEANMRDMSPATTMT